MREYAHHPSNDTEDWGWRDFSDGVDVAVHWLIGTHYTLFSEINAPLVVGILAGDNLGVQAAMHEEVKSESHVSINVDCKWSMSKPEDALRKASSEAQHDMELPRIHVVTVESLIDLMSYACVSVDADISFARAGVTSLQAVRIRNAVQATVGAQLVLPVTLLFEHTSVRKLVTFIDGGLVCRDQQLSSQQNLKCFSAPYDVSHVYGASCKLPGGTDLLSSLQNVTRSCYDASLTSWLENKSSLEYVLCRPEFFDRRHFSIAANEATNIDPQQRHVLEQSYAALHASGAEKATLQGSNLGVAVGIWNTDFAKMQLDAARFSVYNHLNISISVASGRLSFALGLHGPCTTIDTACSSSLVASHLAIRALQHDECKQHLVTGVNMILIEPKTFNSSEPSVLVSTSGRCHSFDQRADGYARAEACSAAVLHKSGRAGEVGVGELHPCHVNIGSFRMITHPTSTPPQA